MYYGLLQMNKAYIVKVENVGLWVRRTLKIQINFNYQQKGKMMDLLTTRIYLPLFKNTWQSCKQRISKQSAFSKTGM